MITVAYWQVRFTSQTGIKHLSKHEMKNREKLIDLFLKHGLNIMLVPQGNGLTLWVDDRKFTQR